MLIDNILFIMNLCRYQRFLSMHPNVDDKFEPVLDVNALRVEKVPMFHADAIYTFPFGYLATFCLANR